MNANKIADYALEKILKPYYIRGKELEPYHTGIRFDLYGLKRSTREMRVLEIKSCRSDFTSDKKWQKYLEYCTHFAFIAPKGVIKPEELPPKIGLIEVWEVDGHLFYEYARNCKTLHDLSDKAYIKILEAIALRKIMAEKALEVIEK